MNPIGVMSLLRAAGPNCRQTDHGATAQVGSALAAPVAVDGQLVRNQRLAADEEHAEVAGHDELHVMTQKPMSVLRPGLLTLLARTVRLFTARICSIDMIAASALTRVDLVAALRHSHAVKYPCNCGRLRGMQAVWQCRLRSLTQGPLRKKLALA